MVIWYVFCMLCVSGIVVGLSVGIHNHRHENYENVAVASAVSVCVNTVLLAAIFLPLSIILGQPHIETYDTYYEDKYDLQTMYSDLQLKGYKTEVKHLPCTFDSYIAHNVLLTPTFTNTTKEVYYVYYVADIPTPEKDFDPDNYLLERKDCD